MQQQPAINADSFILIKLQLYKMFSLLNSLGCAMYMCSVCASTIAFFALFIMRRSVRCGTEGVKWLRKTSEMNKKTL